MRIRKSERYQRIKRKKTKKNNNAEFKKTIVPKISNITVINDALKLLNLGKNNGNINLNNPPQH